MVKVRFRMCKTFYSRKESSDFQPDIAKLKDRDILQEYKLKLSNEIISEKDKPNYEADWNSVKNIILKSAQEAIPSLKRQTRNEWFEEDCKTATENKNKAYRLMLQKHRTRISEKNYKP